MFELTMAALHPYLLPTILVQAFNNASYFHLTFLARLPAAEYQHIPSIFIGNSPQLTKSTTSELTGAGTDVSAETRHHTIPRPVE
jgi:hypothetical protein